MSAKHAALAAEMRDLKADIERREAELKPLKERYDTVRKRELLDAMSEEGVSSFKLDDGGTFYISNSTKGSVTALDQDRFHQWLRDHGFGTLIKPTVNPQTLNAWVKEQREAGMSLPEFVHVFEEPLVAMRR